MNIIAKSPSFKDQSVPEVTIRSFARNTVFEWGVEKIASSYIADFEKLTGKKPEIFEDYLTKKECMRPGHCLVWSLVVPAV
jgi:hypothetical protein